VDSNKAGTSVSSGYTSVYRQQVSDGLPLHNGAPGSLTRKTVREQGIIYKHAKNCKRKNINYKSKKNETEKGQGKYTDEDEKEQNNKVRRVKINRM
jgi:hypothetical protein